MDKALLDFEVSIDADCKLLTVGKPFAIEGTESRHAHFCPDRDQKAAAGVASPLEANAPASGSASAKSERPCSRKLFVLKVQIKRLSFFFPRLNIFFF